MFVLCSEWADGWEPKFGLYRVDLRTFERTPTAAVATFQEIARNAGLTPVP